MSEKLLHAVKINQDFSGHKIVVRHVHVIYGLRDIRSESTTSSLTSKGVAAHKPIFDYTQSIFSVCN